MNTLFYNAKILQSNSDTTWTIIEGEVGVQDSVIIHVGNDVTLKNANVKWDRKIDCQKNILLPGFKNLHTHSAMTFLRSYADNVELDAWLNQYIFPMERKLTPELVYWFTILAIMEYLSSGITTNFDMYFYPTMVAKAAIDTGFRSVQTSSINNFNSSINDLESNYYSINSLSELTSYIVGFHAEYTTSKYIMEEVAKLSDRVGSAVWFHNSETKKEVRECKDRWGLTPTELADRLGLYTHGGGGYHCVWLSESDLEIFRRNNLTAVVNPASNLKLNSGIASINAFLTHGINIAIGTDGAASNNSLDMFKEMFLAAVLAKMSDNSANSINAEQVLYMATVAGANAIGLPECNNIKVGKKADLVLLDIHMPNMQPTHNIIGNIVYSGSKQNVKLTMVNGIILYEDGKYNIGVEPTVVYQETARLLNEIR